jgi:hypothetical protein
MRDGRMLGLVLRPHLKAAKSTRVACWERINGR